MKKMIRLLILLLVFGKFLLALLSFIFQLV